MKRRFYTVVAAVMAIVLAAGCSWLGRDSVKDEIPTAGVVLSAIQSDRAGVDTDSSFRLASAEPLKLAEVKERLSVTPAVELTYEQTDREGKVFTVKPVRALDDNRVYSFRLAAGQSADRPYQWSFQTRAEFRVLGSLPRHQATGVPVDTGLEITFSHENYADVAPFFSISPKIEGRFERHKKTIAFIPKEPLKPGTVYTVTLKPGLTLNGTDLKLAGEFSYAFETAPADQSGRNGKGHFYVGQEVREFPTGEAPYFQVQYYRQEGPAQAPASVSVYRYRDAAQFISALQGADKVPWWAQYSTGRFQEETKGLNRVARFETQLKQMPGHYMPALLFPEPLDAGYYMAELTVEEQVRQVRFQVSDLASYLTVAAGKSLIWVNDVKSKGPVAGAQVTHPGGKAATGADGLAEFATPAGFGRSAAESTGLYLQVRAGGKEAVVAVRAGGYVIYDGGPSLAFRGSMYYPGPMQSTGLPGYWKYLYLDRPLYKPDDTIKLFGVVQPREAGAVPAGQVTASVLRREYRWLGFGAEPPPLVTAQLPVSEGAFSGSLALPNLKPGYYELQVRSGDQHVISRWFEVQAYTKPAYRISVTSDRRAAFAGETINFKAESAFFEGTPVPNLTFNYQIGWGNGVRSTVTTGADGTATIPFTPGFVEQGTHWGGAGQAWFNIWASLPEVGEINTGTGVQVFTRNVTVRPSVDVTEGVATIQAQVNHVTLEKINAGNDWDHVGAAAAGRQIEGILIEQNWVRYEEGEYYDFIEKRVVKQYQYRPDFREVGRFTAVTDSEGKIAHRMNINPEKSYQVKLDVADTNGRAVHQEWYFSGQQYQFQGGKGGYGPYKSYRLAPLDEKKQTWTVGEEVALRLLENDEATAERNGGYLFYQARLGLKEYRVQGEGTYRFTFRESDVPNTTIKGVYFDGRQYHEAWEFPVRFDSSQRELKVAVTPDRSLYRPGENVSVTVQVTDRSGKPVKAHVNLNLVDEALFALRNQEANILAELYGEQVPSGILRTAQTNFESVKQEAAAGAPTAMPAPAAGAATKQAAYDAGGAVRRDFRDTSYFGTVSTDASGRATTTFKLPDNLTTWRMTYQAFAPGMAGAATGTSPVVVKIPFFVDTVFSDIYLTGDKPVIAVRSFGADLGAGQNVDYKVTVTGPSDAKTVNASGKAFTPVSVPMDTLKAGTYTVQVQGAAAGGLQDTLEKKFTVVDSYLKQQKVDYHVLGPQTKLNGPADGLVTVVFTDHLRGRYLQLLNRLRWHGGNRLEQKLAQAVAVDLLKTYFGEQQLYPGSEWNAQSFQAPDGSIAILPYSDGDLYLSALAADAAGDRFDRLALAEYFFQVLDDKKVDRERGITALYGLAALGQPVLQQVREQLAATDLTPAERLRLALAAAALGDLEGARPAYRDLISKHGEKLGSSLRINLGRDQDEILTMTAQAAALGARLGEPEAPALLEYLQENPAKDVLLLLEQLIAAKAALPWLRTESAVFTYMEGGQEKLMELKPGEQVRWTITAAQLQSMQFKPQQGQIGVTVSYEAPLSAAELKQEPGYEVSRTYSVEGKGPGTTWEQGDLVRITLTYRIPGTAPSGGFELTDYLPSGLRLVQRPWQHGISFKSGNGPAWPLAVNGQQVTFWAWEKGDPIYYYARVISPGAYTAEQPVLQHQKSGAIFGHGQRDSILIQH